MVELFGDAGRGGEWAALTLLVGDDGRITRVSGSGPGTAEAASRLPCSTLLEAAAIPIPGLAGDALAAALGPAISAPPNPRRVAVAMSGGVDSAVALLEARDAGFDAVGVTLRLWVDPSAGDGERACCSPSAVVAARELCHSLGVPHVTLDRREAFLGTVVQPFVAGYARGETPNPCTRCNGELRFEELLAFADRIGAARLATGHYARTVEHRGRLLLARGVDERKDQSYMLGTLDPGMLGRVWFPLGDRTKDAVRTRARAAGLAAAGRPESQEACFLGGGDYRTFLAGQGLPAADGPVVDLSGREVGRHAGYWRYTPGQRRGLRIGGAERPVYALRTLPRSNTVVVGARRDLARTRVRLRSARLHVPLARVEAKLRYRSPAVEARIVAAEGGCELLLEEPAYGVAPGQAAVLYEQDVVVGAGVIDAAA